MARKASNAGKGAAAGGGIGAKKGKGFPAASAASATRGRGSGAIAATGSKAAPNFGIGAGRSTAGSPRPSSQRRSTAKSVTGSAAFPVVPTLADGTPYKPRSTFADSTVKRGDGKKSPTKPGKVFDPDGDGDNDATPSGDTDHDYWSPSGKQLKPLPGKPLPKKASETDTVPKSTDGQMRSARRQATSVSRKGPADDYASMGVQSPGNHLADLKPGETKFPKKGIITPSHKGLFTAKAKDAGMSTQAYAAHVLAAKKGTFDPETVRQANFARNFGGGK